MSGCGQETESVNPKEITEIALTYHSAEWKEKGPFETNTYTEAEYIKIFTEVIDQSEEISGELNYEPEFNMKLLFDDGTTEDYYLALGEIRGNEGLLVSTKNSGQGYSIPVQNSDQLRELVFGVISSTALIPSENMKASVNVLGPVTISRNSLFLITDKAEFLDLQLLEGQYSEDWVTPSPLIGRSWMGLFQLVVTNEQGNVLSTFSLSDHYNEELFFNDFFQIQFDDYNGDGDPDFTIGQYGSSNGNFYKLFTIRQGNIIEELSIQPSRELFISGLERYSAKLDKVGANGFKKSYYDNAAGKNIENIYEWDGSVFQKK